MPKTGPAPSSAVKPRKAASRSGKVCKGHFVMGELRDFPRRTMQENEAERQATFARAWAQKAAREAAEARGEVFVPEWQKEAALKAAPAASPKVAPKPTAADKARLAALNRAMDSDSD